MRKTLRGRWRQIAGGACCMATLVAATPAYATTYYINPVGGVLADGTDGINTAFDPATGQMQSRRKGLVNYHSGWPLGGNLSTMFNLRINNATNFGDHATAFINAVVSSDTANPAAGPSGSGTQADPWKIYVDHDAVYSGVTYHQRIEFS